MKLAVTLNDHKKLKALLSSNVSTIIIGVEGLSHRMEETHSLDAVAPFITEIKAANKAVWINMNIIMHDQHLPDVEAALEYLKPYPIDGILFADLAVVVLAEKYDFVQKLIYYPETYTTSRIDATFWHEEKIQSIVLARELTLKDITDIAIDSPIPITIVGHGYLNMFHSRRPLVENYFKYTQEEDPDQMKESKKLTLIEEQRDEAYKIVQDAFGTHIFRAKPLASFKVLNTLKGLIDTLMIDSLFLEDTILEVIEDYHQALNESNETLTDKYLNDYDDGFYFKKTILNKKGEPA